MATHSIWGKTCGIITCGYKLTQERLFTKAISNTIFFFLQSLSFKGGYSLSLSSRRKLSVSTFLGCCSLWIFLSSLERHTPRGWGSRGSSRSLSLGITRRTWVVQVGERHALKAAGLVCMLKSRSGTESTLRKRMVLCCDGGCSLQGGHSCVPF